MSSSFADFGLDPRLLNGLAALGITTPTPVQEHAIPFVLQGKDAIVLAKTGSGKTLAFGLPLMTMLRPGQRKPQALVVLPTRELAIQVCEAIDAVGRPADLRITPIYGGVGLGPQEAALARGTDVVVGTPGRLKDLMNRQTLDLSQVRVLILDEADEMLDMGFRRDIEFIMDRLPAREQTLILSATMPDAIETIAHRHLKDPAIVRLTQTDDTPSEISHYFMRLEADDRLTGLVALLKAEDPERAIIFTRMKHETKRIAQKLEKMAGIQAGYLNGNMSQNARNTMLARFRAGEFRFLIATDVAARGLHVDGLTHVIHFAVPTVVETYIHRSGRTGRAGNSGKTIIMVTPDAEADFRAISKRVECLEMRIDGIPLPSPTAPRAQTATPERGRSANPAPSRRSGGEQGRNGGRSDNRGRGQGRSNGRTEAGSDNRNQGRPVSGEARNDGRSQGRGTPRNDGQAQGRGDSRNDERNQSRGDVRNDGRTQGGSDARGDVRRDDRQPAQAQRPRQDNAPTGQNGRNGRGSKPNPPIAQVQKGSMQDLWNQAYGNR